MSANDSILSTNSTAPNTAQVQITGTPQKPQQDALRVATAVAPTTPPAQQQLLLAKVDKYETYFVPLPDNVAVVTGEDEEELENYEPNLEFTPHEPLPEVYVVIGEKNEEVKFTDRAKLFLFVREPKEMKERGLGNIKLLYHPEKKKYRVVMCRAHVPEVCANFHILADTKVTRRDGQRNVLSFAVVDFSEMPSGRVEVFLIKFQTEEQANLFVGAIEVAQKDLMETST